MIMYDNLMWTHIYFIYFFLFLVFKYKIHSNFGQNVYVFLSYVKKSKVSYCAKIVIIRV